jgi:hypothetical protein
MKRPLWQSPEGLKLLDETLASGSPSEQTLSQFRNLRSQLRQKTAPADQPPGASDTELTSWKQSDASVPAKET